MAINLHWGVLLVVFRVTGSICISTSFFVSLLLYDMWTHHSAPLVSWSSAYILPPSLFIKLRTSLTALSSLVSLPLSSSQSAAFLACTTRSCCSATTWTTRTSCRGWPQQKTSTKETSLRWCFLVCKLQWNRFIFEWCLNLTVSHWHFDLALCGWATALLVGELLWLSSHQQQSS